MAGKKKKGPPSGKGKLKYRKPKMTRHGNLETVAQRISGAVGSSCCVSERLRKARTSAAERGRLTTLASQAVSILG